MTIWNTPNGETPIDSPLFACSPLHMGTIRGPLGTENFRLEVRVPGDAEDDVFFYFPNEKSTTRRICREYGSKFRGSFGKSKFFFFLVA